MRDWYIGKTGRKKEMGLISSVGTTLKILIIVVCIVGIGSLLIGKVQTLSARSRPKEKWLRNITRGVQVTFGRQQRQEIHDQST